MNEQQANIIKTNDIKKSLQKYAHKHEMAIDICDFSIKKTTNYIKTSADEDFVLFNENIKETYKTDEDILNEHVEFQQLYTIHIFRKKNYEIRLKYTIELGEFADHPKIVIDPKSIIPYKTRNKREVLILLVKEINKIKAKNKILINIFDDKMTSILKSFVKHIYDGKFTKKIRIPLFEGIYPEINRESELILHYKDKEKDSKIAEVEVNEVLVEYIKPIYGKKGLDAYGRLIDNSFKTNVDDYSYDIDETAISIKETKRKKLYISKKKGFVHLVNHMLTVDNKLKLHSMSRVNKTLTKDEDNNIEVQVAQNDTTKDSIGEGVKLTSEVIHITGHVGAKSTLESYKLQIDGATHKSSKQFSKFAQINRHKGVLRCNEAKITLLEGGEVHATKAEVTAAIGGTIYAQEVKIKNARSNLKVYASKKIEIELVSGEDNYFIIDYAKIPILESKINLIHKDIDDLKYQLEESKKHEDKEDINILEEKIKLLRHEEQEVINSTLKATIEIEKPLRGLNTISFVLDDKGHDLTYKTDARLYKTFYLEVKEDEFTLHPINKKLIIS